MPLSATMMHFRLAASLNLLWTTDKAQETVRWSRRIRSSGTSPMAVLMPRAGAIVCILWCEGAKTAMEGAYNNVSEEDSSSLKGTWDEKLAASPAATCKTCRVPDPDGDLLQGLKNHQDGRIKMGEHDGHGHSHASSKVVRARDGGIRSTVTVE